MRKIKPLNDFIFKKLFGEKGNEDILEAFINAVLSRTNKGPITGVEIIDNKELTKELTKELIGDKTGIIDVRAKTLNGEHMDIEVQLTNQGNMDKRTLFYWGKLYLENIKKGEDYKKLEKVITINILDFEFLYTTNYQSSFHLWEDIDKDYMLTDLIEIHFLELPKFIKKESKNFKDNPIERWLAFLEEDTSETMLKELMSMEPAIKKAEDKLEYLSSDEETMNIYWERERSLHERANMISSAEERGEERGFDKAIHKVAKSLLDVLDNETIASKTGLPLEDIIQIRNKNNV